MTGRAAHLAGVLSAFLAAAAAAHPAEPSGRFGVVSDIQPDFSASAVAAMWQSVRDGGPERRTFARYYDVSRGALDDDTLPAHVCAVRFLQDAADFADCYCG